MRLAVRWGAAVAVPAAGFVLCWWVCQELAGLDEGVSLGVAGAVLALVLAVTGWWAARERPGAGDRGAAGWRVWQRARAGRDVTMAGRDQVITIVRREDQ